MDWSGLTKTLQNVIREVGLFALYLEEKEGKWVEKGRRMREKKTGTNKKLRGGGVDGGGGGVFHVCVCV